MVTRTNPSPAAPKSSPRPVATRPRSRNTDAGSSQPSDEQSTHARYPASGGTYPAPGSRAASSGPNSTRTRSSWTSSASSHGPPDRQAASDASTPSSPDPYRTVSGIRATTAAPSADPETATAHFSPAMLNALDDDASVTPTAAPAGNETKGVCTAPGNVSGA